MQALLQHRPGLRPRYAILIAILVLAVNLGVSLVVQNLATRQSILYVLSPTINALTTLILFRAARDSARLSRRTAKAWYYFAFAQLAFTLGDICWAVLELGLKQNPYPSIADFGYLAFYPLFIIGTCLATHRTHSVLDWAKRFLDLGIILLASLLGYWNFLIGPLLSSIGREPFYFQALTIAYPILDLVLLVALFWLISSDYKSYTRLPIVLLVISLTLTIVADTLFGYQTLSISYAPGELADLGWLIESILTGLAGYFQIHSIQVNSEPQNQEIRQNSGEFVGHKYFTYLPYLWLIFAFSLLNPAFSASIHINKMWIFIGVTVIGMMVVSRQIITLEENRWLNKRLETILGHVQKQASILEETNKELQTEIVARQKIEEQLSYDALHDSLTNLPNRTLFIDRLEKAIERSKADPSLQYSVLFLDIDQFKGINDSLGHAVGDELLAVIAQRLKDCLRSSDTAARLGGDEFVILLENKSTSSKEETISFIVNRVQDQIQQQVDLEGRSVFFTTSIGIVLAISQYTSPTEILRDADIAMYRAKALGKDRYEIFTEELRKQSFTRSDIEESLRFALDNQQFELNFQPIVKLDTYQLIGFESFIRWNHPVYGVLLPNDFIPLAEEQNNINEIGNWVLLESCQQVKRWQEKHQEYKNLIVDVNISGKQFSQPLFTKQVEKVLDETSLNPKLLKLEITEAILIENFLTNSDKLQFLNELGVQIEIDNFGTGFSSLAYIQNFPIHIIKIDRSFVKDIGKKRKVSELIRAIISMAHDLNMETVAEGIETIDQMNELKNMGCDYGQGFLISDPLSISMAGSLLEGATSLFPKKA